MRCDVVHAACLFAAACGSPSPAATDAPAGPGWATYVIATGAHDAQLVDREPKNPIDGVVSVAGRDYELVLDPSAIYELTAPVEPEDQLDWNKLPGLSDCNTIDLSIDGIMLGWRWRLDTSELEITAYANNAGVHLTSAAPLVTLSAADLDAREPLRYRLWRDSIHYQVSIAGNLRGRAISAEGSLPRRCDIEIDPLAWAAGFYFGGTSVAPHEVTAAIHETMFVP